MAAATIIIVVFFIVIVIIIIRPGGIKVYACVCLYVCVRRCLCLSVSRRRLCLTTPPLTLGNKIRRPGEDEKGRRPMCEWFED